MKIDDLSITLFAWNDIPPHSYLGRGPFDPAGKADQVGELALVTIRTDDGVEGHSFLGLGASGPAQQLLRMLKPIVMGRDPLAREQLYQEMLERRLVVQPWVVGAVDVALWDLAGKAAGEPIHRLLGTYRDRLPAYASSEQQPSVEAYV
ncbi:MAG: mandelate racemase, partial [Acidobacteria bacterium]|nr:mandelate racemase [Acidobacteriota bacterium]